MAEVVNIDEKNKRATLTFDLDELKMIIYWMLQCDLNAQRGTTPCLLAMLGVFEKADKCICGNIRKAIDECLEKLDEDIDKRIESVKTLEDTKEKKRLTYTLPAYFK